jgi:hypothetical protein
MGHADGHRQDDCYPIRRCFLRRVTSSRGTGHLVQTLGLHDGAIRPEGNRAVRRLSPGNSPASGTSLRTTRHSQSSPIRRTTFFLPWTLKENSVPFDFQARPLVQVHRRAAFRGIVRVHLALHAFPGKDYFSLSTTTATKPAVDGKPYRFLHALLEFDPATRRFDFPTLNSANAYYQMSYTMATATPFLRPARTSRNRTAP